MSTSLLESVPLNWQQQAIFIHFCCYMSRDELRSRTTDKSEWSSSWLPEGLSQSHFTTSRPNGGTSRVCSCHLLSTKIKMIIV
jgi:hypothetical protein